MDKCLLPDFRKTLEENEKLADGCQLFALREDGYICRYFKLGNKYSRSRDFYDLSICDKKWFKRKLNDNSIPDKEHYPFYKCQYNDAHDPNKTEEISYEEYLEAKEKAINLSDERKAKIPEKKKERAKREEEHNNANDGKTAYMFRFHYNGYIYDDVYVRAYTAEEGRKLAEEKHIEFTKDWVYPDAHKFAACQLCNAVPPKTNK